ncbi:MAG: T9SS type A sorting domain-containing protein [Bacteroidia bacterium]|nr:T9SS type A sorting domain-containing protein [Bacteroidia bacterium]
MKNILLIFYLSAVWQLSAQYIPRQAMSSAGGMASGNGYMIGWTIGQTGTNTLQSGSNILVQGFQQADPDSIASLNTGGGGNGNNNGNGGNNAFVPSLNRDVIGSAGVTSIGNGYNLCWTVGEANILTIGANPLLTQGFHQPDDSTQSPNGNANNNNYGLGNFGSGGNGQSFTYNSSGQLVNQTVAGTSPMPTNATPANQANCMGLTVTLSVTGNANATFNWYNQQAGGTLLGTGNTFITPPLTINTTYYVEAVVNGCPSDRVPIPVTVSPCLTTNAVATGPHCAGSTISIPFTAVGSSNPVNIFSAELSNASGSFSSPVIIGTLNGTTSGTIVAQIPPNTPAGSGYRVRVTSSSPASVGLDNGADITITAPNFTPTTTVNRTSICIGGSATFTNTFIGTPTPYTRQWQVSTDNITYSNVSGATSGTYTATFNTAGTYYYRIAVIKSGQCSGYSNAIAVTVVPDPSVTITGGATYCGSGATTFMANPVYGVGTNTLKWQISTNNATWTNVSNATNPTYTTPTLTGTRYYRAVVTSSGNGCNTGVSNVGVITVNPNPALVANPTSSTICIGGVRTLQISGATAYVWSPATGLNSTTGSSVTASPTTTTTYTILGTNTATGCNSTITTTVNVVPDAFISSITGNLSLCSGGSTLLTANITGGNGTCNVTWQSSTNGTTWTTINIPNTTTAYVGTTYQTPNLTANRYYRARVTGCTGIGCGASGYSSSVMVAVTPDPVITISSSATNVCNNGSVNLNATVTGGLGSCPITWQLSTNGTTWSNTGGNSASLAVYSITSTRYYRAIINCNGVGCSIDTSNTLTLNVVANPTVTLTGGGTYSSGSPVTLTVNVSGGSGVCTYSWFTRPNAQSPFTLISGVNTATYSFTASATAQYRVQAFCNSCASVYSNIPTVTVTPPSRYANPELQTSNSESLTAFSLYPNPASEKITLEGKGLQDGTFSILLMDMMGKTVGEWEEKTEVPDWSGEFDISLLSIGIYYYRIKQGNFEQMIKFVKE